jgi:hypothetical protein
MAVTAAAAPAPGEKLRAGATTPAERHAVTFDAIVARVGEAADSGAWKTPGWKDGRDIGEGLEELVGQIRTATGREDLALPVELADVQPDEPAAGNADADAAGPAGKKGAQRLLPGTLLVCREASVARATRAIILADGSARVGFAEECVIVARGAVEIAHGSRNVVVAGHYIHVSHDGSAARARDAARGKPQGSVLVSGGYVDVSHATTTVASAPGLVRIGHANGVTFVNSPNRDVSHQKGSAEARIDGARLAPPEKANPLSDRLTLTRLLPGGDARGSAVFQCGDVQVELRPGDEVHDGNGKVIPGFEGWKLTYVSTGSEGFALLSRGREDAAFMLK